MSVQREWTFPQEEINLKEESNSQLTAELKSTWKIWLPLETRIQEPKFLQLSSEVENEIKVTERH